MNRLVEGIFRKWPTLSLVVLIAVFHSAVSLPTMSSNNVEAVQDTNQLREEAPRTIRETMERVMNYFRNADFFDSLRTVLDSNNGVRKEWVPLGSLMFGSPLGQQTG